MRGFLLRQPVVLAAAFALAMAGCDVSGSEPAPSFVEGTYTLPDGTRASFRTEGFANAFEYSGIGTSDVFQFGTQYTVPEDPEAIQISVGFSQNGLAPTPGAFTAHVDSTDRQLIQASFSITNVPGVQVEGLLPEYASSLLVNFPEGTVDLRLVGQTLVGEFALEGEAFSTGETVYAARVEGRFEIPYEPYRSQR